MMIIIFLILIFVLVVLIVLFSNNIHMKSHLPLKIG